MASLEQLKKKLRSVELTGQLTTAMKTVSSAKYAKLSKLFSDYKLYAESLEALSAYCSLNHSMANTPQKEAPDCYVIIGHNRGFCGAYNAELHAFADKVLKDHPNSIVVCCGKKAISFLENKGYALQETYPIPDVSGFAGCSKMIDDIYALYRSGKVKTVNIIYKKFINIMHQETVLEPFLPFTTGGESKNDGEVLFLPDEETVVADLQIKMMKSKWYYCMLSAAIGAQASTLLAMRTAVDHANEKAGILNHEIHKKRQMAVTSGVIETSSGLAEGDV